MTSVHIALFLKLPLHVVGLREGSHSTSKVSRTDKTDSNRRFLCIVSSVLMTQFRWASNVRQLHTVGKEYSSAL